MYHIKITQTVVLTVNHQCNHKPSHPSCVVDLYRESYNDKVLLFFFFFSETVPGPHILHRSVTETRQQELLIYRFQCVPFHSKEKINVLIGTELNSFFSFFFGKLLKITDMQGFG